MKVLWELFEISVNFYQGFIMVYFAYAFLEDKKRRKFVKSPGMFYGIILAAMLSILNYVTIFEHYYTLIYFAIIMIYSVTVLKGRFLSKFFASAFPILIMAVATTFIGNFSAILLKTNLYNLLSENNINRLAAMIATQLCILYFTMISLKIFKSKTKSNHELAVREWILISVVLIISVVIAAILNITSLKLYSGVNDVYIVVALAGIILINIVVCYLVIDLDKKNKVVRENEMLKIAREYNRQYVENANTEYDAIRKLRHDFKDNYSVIYALLSEGKSAKAMRHIENLQSNLVGTDVFVRTDNDIVNAIVNAKFSAAKSFGIESVCLSIKTFNGIDDLDLCRLLSNMLENAITACVNAKSSEKSIYLKITSDEYNYNFNLKNTIDKSVLKDNPGLSTTKKNKANHGYGTKIIKEISNKYNGKCDFYEEDNYFCCNVVLMR